MAEEKVPFLCGGIFFFLISGIRQGASANEHARGIKDEIKNEDIMDDLVFAVTGNRYSPNKSEVSQYRSCNINGTAGIPFDDMSVRDSFSQAVLYNYNSIHRRITDFLDVYMTGDQPQWFVRALLDIILRDKSIPEDAEFFIQSGGLSKAKSEIRNIHEFDYQPFVLGVLHYIVTERYGRNTEGKATFTSWKKKVGNEYKYNGNAGTGIAYKIEVNDCRPREESVCEQLEKTVDTPIASAEDTRTDDEVIFDNLKGPLEMFAEAFKAQKHQWAEQIRQNNKKSDSSVDEPETAEAEVVDGEVPSGAAEEDKKITVIKQQTNVIQNGDNNLNVTNNGTMNFNF